MLLRKMMILMTGAMILTACDKQTLNSASTDTTQAWLTQNAIQIKTPVAGNGLDDLEALGDLIGDARVVGLGEATHGTREFFQFKHRIFEYLVEEKGFRAFGFEADFASTYGLSQYVATGEGDPEELIHDMMFWTWDTEEVLDLVRWMRKYNETHDEQLTFFGYDIQNALRGIEYALEYMAAHDDPKKAYFEEAFSELIDASDTYENYAKYMLSAEMPKKLELRAATEELILHMEYKRASYMNKTGFEAYDIAHRHAMSAKQLFWAYTILNDGPGSQLPLSFDIRDASMADNVLWMLEKMGSGGKMALWAHNAHVSKAMLANIYSTMGGNLKQILGDDYISMGFSFYQGKFQARGQLENLTDVDALPPLMEYNVGPAWPGSIGEMMESANVGDFLVDMRVAPEESEAGQWFRSGHPKREAGAAYMKEPETEKELMQMLEQAPKTVPLDNFDFMIFFRDTTRARPLQRTLDRFNMTKNW